MGLVETGVLEARENWEVLGCSQLIIQVGAGAGKKEGPLRNPKRLPKESANSRCFLNDART